MSELPSQVERSIRAHRLFAHGQRILVAVSGGLDSMVLLRLLHELAPKHGWRLIVAHLNHRLRGPSSSADERLVQRTAERLGLPVQVARADVRGFARAQHLSLEMAARKVRHDFLARTAAQLRIRTVALAHQAEDQLELFFLRLFRGSGGEGLGGMRWRNPSPCNPQIELVRPLLDQPKSALLQHAQQTGIRFREDATNSSLDFQRNRIRHELLPLLRTKYQPALGSVIARTVDILGVEADFAAQAAREWLSRRLKGTQRRGNAERRSGAHRTGISNASIPFEKLPIAVQRRAVQLQLLDQGIAADYTLVERLRSNPDKPVSIGVAQKQTGARQDTPPSPREADSRRNDGPGDDSAASGKPPMLTALRKRDGIVRLEVLQPEGFRPGSLEVRLDGESGRCQFSGAVIRWRFRRHRRFEQPRPIGGRECFDADRVGSSIQLRHWQPGDRFQPIGMAHPVKLQNLFTNCRVPRRARRGLIVATTATGEVFWVEGIRISERFKLSKHTIRRLQWHWNRP